MYNPAINPAINLMKCLLGWRVLHVLRGLALPLIERLPQGGSRMYFMWRETLIHWTSMFEHLKHRQKKSGAKLFKKYLSPGPTLNITHRMFDVRHRGLKDP